MARYGLDESSYASYCLPPSTANIPKIDSDPSALAAKGRIELAIKQRESVLIYGDYDTDGIMATSICAYALAKRGLDPAFFIPSRYLDGYGLNMENAERIAKNERNYSLVILVDNGICCHKEISYLKDKGIDVVVIDHHEPKETLPSAFAIIHPLTIGYGDYPVSAGYLSYLFSILLLGYEDDYLRTLGALSTLSDMMPLHGHNREIVRLALEDIQAKGYPSILTLTDSKYFDETVLTMGVIPVINSIGRVEKGHQGISVVKHFLKNDQSCYDSAAKMKEINLKRKQRTREAVNEVKVDPSAPGIVALTNLPEGLNGLLANQLLGTYERPIAVFSPCEKDPSSYVGSLRGKEGFSVIEAIASLNQKGLLVAGGGHKFAGGVTVKKENFASFRKEWDFLSLKHPFQKVDEDYIQIGLSDCTFENYELIKTFGPFGQDHPKPSFLLKGIKTNGLVFSKDGKYLVTPLGYGVSLHSFKIGKKELEGYHSVDLKANFGLNEWKGNLQLRIEASLLGGE